jgi:glycosyltransferase involved in cell wall biosynthesis
MRDPLVSCVIIFLDEEKYLGEAIESVLAQSFDNWELLLVDDGSTDGSGGLARSYRDQHPDRIHYHTHDGGRNRGMSASRNLGLNAARGSFIGFLDGDDVWLPDKLERQVALFEAHPAAVIICGATIYWHNWQADAARADRLVRVGDIRSSETPPACTIDQDRLYDPPTLATRLYPLGRGVTPSTSGLLIRREMALAVGGFEEEFRGLFEDQVFLAKAYLAGPIFVSSQCFDQYRQHDESCCFVTRSTAVSHEQKRRYFDWLSAYFRRQDFRDRAVLAALRRKKLQHEFPRIHRLYVNSRRRIFGVNTRP